MNIVIIGSEGFIGKHLYSYFNVSGNSITSVDIVNVDRPNHVVIDTQNSDFAGIFKKTRFDLCINASGSANVQFSFQNPSVDFLLNVQNVQNLLEAIRAIQPTCKFLNFSSAAVYGNPVHLPIKEKEDLQPLSPYGWHKLMSETLCRYYFQYFGILTLSLRVFSAYGQGLKKQIFWDISQKYAQHGKVELFGTGNETRDFIHVTDLVRAIDLIVQNGVWDGEAINIASGQEASIRYVTKCLLDRMGNHIEPSFNGLVKPGDPLNWRADISRIESYGFKTTISIEEGLAQYADWIKSVNQIN